MYLADKYDVDAEASKIRANERIKSSTQSMFSATALGYHTVVPTHTGIRFENGKIRYALLPVWMLNTPKLNDRQFEALLSSRNALYEIFEQWCKNGELHGLADIGIAIEEAADRILVSLSQQEVTNEHT